MPGWVWILASIVSLWALLGLVACLFLGAAADLRDRPPSDGPEGS